MHEIRHLVFSGQELQELALGFLDARGERPNLVGPIWALAESGEGIRLVLTYTNARSPNRQSMAFDNSDLLSASILFCKRRRVPLPMRGQKRLELVKGALALVVAMRMGD